jgi:hypothetical protein
MKQKRDANGKFVKMYLSREEYVAKIAELEKTVDNLASQAQEAKNEAAFWKQEYGVMKKAYEESDDKVLDLEIVKAWFLKNCGPILRWRYYKAVEEEAL